MLAKVQCASPETPATDSRAGDTDGRAGDTDGRAGDTDGRADDTAGQTHQTTNHRETNGLRMMIHVA